MKLGEIIFNLRTDTMIAIKKSIDDLEKAGQNTTVAFAKAGMRSDLNY